MSEEMTREQAIKVFENMKKGIMPFYPEQYCDMAIKALEQEPCEDAISRAEALKAINEMDIPEDMSVFEIKSHIGVKISILPLIQPQPKTGHWIDAVEVVRCRECKYCRKEDESEYWCYGFCSPTRLVRKDDFCSHGCKCE